MIGDTDVLRGTDPQAALTTFSQSGNTDVEQDEKRRPLTRTLLRIAILLMLAAFCYQSGFSEGREHERDEQYDERIAEARRRLDSDFRDILPVTPLNAIDEPARDAEAAAPLEALPSLSSQG